MHTPRKRRDDFDAARVYEYPEHLRPVIADLPSCPGVYIFHGEDGDLPVYIGKSINLRSRVLSHLRNPEEARMLRQTRSISHIRTAGEIGALLLEAQLIKERHPLVNQKLRRNRQLCSLQVRDGMPQVVYSKDVDFATEPDLYGLFGSRHAALEGLRALADQHKLCYGALGLEKLSPGRGCFRAMLQQCAGVCQGRESATDHQRRLFTGLEELKVATWPFPGAIGLVERWQDADRTESAVEVQVHAIRNWHYLGSTHSVEEARSFTRVAAGFDADGYKILAKPILTQSVEIVLL